MRSTYKINKSTVVFSLLLTAGVLIYDIFMILYLTNASKCDQYMNKQDSEFRKVALIFTYISAILIGLNILLTIPILLL